VNQRTLAAGAALLLLCACHGSGAGVGGACKTDSDCSGSLTCKTDANGYPGGLCTADCSSKACTTGNLCTTVSGQSICLQACSKDTDCRTGYACCAASGNVCLTSAQCTAPSCQRPVVASTLPAAQVLTFGPGPHTVGDVIPFVVPANTGSVTIVHQALSAGLTVTLQTPSGAQVIDNSAVPGVIKFPNGTEAYNDNTQSDPASPDGGVDSSGKFAFYGGGTPSTAAFTFPNTSSSAGAGALTPGTWKFSVNDYAYECATTPGCTAGASSSDTYDVSVLLRPLPSGSNLDVNFYIVASGQLTAATAGANPSAQRMVNTFKSLYAAAGITVRNVTFYDTSAADQARFGTNVNADKTGPCDELNQMFLLSAAHPGTPAAPAPMNLFLVQSITSNTPNPGGTIVGIDGTIPGPSSFTGTVHSGAAVSLADLFSIQSGGSCTGAIDLRCGADVTAYIAAHETGHFLGLFHTTESTGNYFDPISDTPKCACMTCATSTDLSKCAKPDATGPTLQADRCCFGSSSAACQAPGSTCLGGDNLMFWQLYGGLSKGTLSAQQGSVMRLNPLLQ
jgi:hypothetical protein